MLIRSSFNKSRLAVIAVLAVMSAATPALAQSFGYPGSRCLTTLRATARGHGDHGAHHSQLSLPAGCMHSLAIIVGSPDSQAFGIRIAAQINPAPNKSGAHRQKQYWLQTNC
jgi:hypothetical protein